MVTWKCKALACNCTLIFRYVNMIGNAPVFWNVKKGKIFPCTAITSNKPIIS